MYFYELAAMKGDVDARHALGIMEARTAMWIEPRNTYDCSGGWLQELSLKGRFDNYTQMGMQQKTITPPLCKPINRT